MASSPLIDHVPEDSRTFINRNEKVSKFIDSARRWNLVELLGVLPTQIIENIQNILIPLSDVQDRIIWNYTNDGEFSVKTASWANNDKIIPHPRAKILNHTWKLQSPQD